MYDCGGWGCVIFDIDVIWDYDVIDFSRSWVIDLDEEVIFQSFHFVFEIG